MNASPTPPAARAAPPPTPAEIGRELRWLHMSLKIQIILARLTLVIVGLVMLTVGLVGASEGAWSAIGWPVWVGTVALLISAVWLALALTVRRQLERGQDASVLLWFFFTVSALNNFPIGLALAYMMYPALTRLQAIDAVQQGRADRRWTSKALPLLPATQVSFARVRWDTPELTHERARRQAQLAEVSPQARRPTQTLRMLRRGLVWQLALSVIGVALGAGVAGVLGALLANTAPELWALMAQTSGTDMAFTRHDAGVLLGMIGTVLILPPLMLGACALWARVRWSQGRSPVTALWISAVLTGLWMPIGAWLVGLIVPALVDPRVSALLERGEGWQEDAPLPAVPGMARDFSGALVAAQAEWPAPSPELSAGPTPEPTAESTPL